MKKMTKGMSINFKDYECSIIESLKKSHFKDVYRVSCSNGERLKAILKVIVDTKELSENLNFFYRLKSNLFVEIIDFNYKEGDNLLNYYYILIREYSGGNLFEYINKKFDNIDRDKKYNIIKRVLEASCYLHKNSYLHCKITPESFFIDIDSQGAKKVAEVDSNIKVLLGDLESVKRLKSIHTPLNRSFEATSYRYISSEGYSIRDELLSIIATIFFIAQGYPLVEDNLINSFKSDEELNSYILDKIDRLKDETLKEILTRYIKKLSNGDKFTACDILKELKADKEKGENIISPDSREDKEDNSKNSTSTVSTVIKVSIILILSLLLVYYFIKLNNKMDSFKLEESSKTTKNRINIDKDKESNIVENLSKENSTINKPPLENPSTVIEQPCKEAYFLDIKNIDYKIIKVIKDKKRNSFSLYRIDGKDIKKISYDDIYLYSGYPTKKENLCRDNQIVIE